MDGTDFSHAVPHLSEFLQPPTSTLTRNARLFFNPALTTIVGEQTRPGRKGHQTILHPSGLVAFGASQPRRAGGLLRCIRPPVVPGTGSGVLGYEHYREPTFCLASPNPCF